MYWTKLMALTFVRAYIVHGDEEVAEMKRYFGHLLYRFDIILCIGYCMCVQR